MKLFNILTAISLILFIGCGGSGEQQMESTSESQETEMGSNVRTINVIGVDQMQYVVEEEADGITLGKPVGADSLLKLTGITAEPGEEIRIRLTTQSKLPATAMAHNWVLLAMNTDAGAFANAAAKARDNDYIPADMTDQIIVQTELAGGGETVEVTFTVPEEPGDYDFLCTFPGHYAAGMSGVLTVEGSQASM